MMQNVIEIFRVSDKQCKIEKIALWT